MMHNPIEAGLALDALPIGTQLVACGVEANGTAYGLLLEHSESQLGNRYWRSRTDSQNFTASAVTQHFDDMVITRTAVAA